MRPLTLHIQFGEHQAAIPYFEIHGRRPGPHIFLSAGMHGGEINGIAVIEAFLQWSERVNLGGRLRGKLTILPLLNPSGFAHKQRRVYEDNADLNRAFAIRPATTFTEQIALELTGKLLKQCEFGIDFHDASVTAALLPHARVHKNELCGFIFSLQQLNQVAAGDTLFSILETDACHVDRTTLNHFRELENLKVTKIRM